MSSHLMSHSIEKEAYSGAGGAEYQTIHSIGQDRSIFVPPGVECGAPARLKVYPDGSGYLQIATKPIFGPRGTQMEGRKGRFKTDDELERSSVGSGSIAAAAAKRRIRDICKCTDFRYFVTFTLDKRKIERYDFGEIYPKLRVWLSNNVQRRGLAYIIVPERHKDGAIHFHGLLNGALAADMVGSGHLTDRKQPIYNLSRWDYGFTSCVPLNGEYDAVIGYILKYISKQADDGKIGGRYYYSGGPLMDEGEPLIRLLDCGLPSTAEKVYHVDGLDCDMVYLRFADVSSMADMLAQCSQWG